MIPYILYNQEKREEEGAIEPIYSKFCRPKTKYDKKYLYVLSSEICEDWNPPFTWFGKHKLPDYVINDIKEKRAVVLIDICLEAIPSNMFKTVFKQFQTLNNFSDSDKDNILYITSNICHDEITGCTVISDNFCLAAVKNIWFNVYNLNNYNINETLSEIFDFRKNREWEYKFACLQQRPRTFRKTLYNKLREKYTIEESICSLRTDDEVGFVEKSPYDTHSDSEILNWDHINILHYSKIKFAVVSERNYLKLEEECPFTTEKVLKNLIIPQPFVLCSFKGHIKELKRLGFLLYEDLIDHSYDELEDEYRMDAAIEELNRIIDVEPDLYIEQAIHNINIIKQSQTLEKIFTIISKILDIRE